MDLRKLISRSKQFYNSNIHVRVNLKTKYIIFSIIFILILGVSAVGFGTHYRKIKETIYDNIIFSYEKLFISDSLKKQFEQYAVNVREPYNKTYVRDKLIRIGSKKLRNHRYANYSFDLADYLNKKETIQRGKKIRDEYWKEYNPFDKDEYVRRFKTVVGYHEKIPPKGSIIKREKISNKFGHVLEKLLFSGRFGVPFIVFHGMPREPAKGILIALHGRRSGPDYVMGIHDKSDYTRSFGAYWLKEGFEVYAPQVDWDDSFPLTRLNYTPQGADLSKIKDILHFIRLEGTGIKKKIPIIVSGISYGSKLAEFSGIIFDEVDVVISIGGNARGDFFDGLLEGQGKKDPTEEIHFSYLPPTYLFYYSGVGLYKLIAPKPLVISIGTHDHGEGKFEMIFDTIDYYRSIGMGDRIKLNVFKGRHEADPEGEYRAFEALNLTK